MYVYHFHNFENVVVLKIRDELAKGKVVYNLPDLFPETHAYESFSWQAGHNLQQRKDAKLFKDFDATTYGVFCGKYLIMSPEVMLNQVITITAGKDCLKLQLNNDYPYEIFPSSLDNFILMSYWDMELSCNFPPDPSEKRKTFTMEGTGFSLSAKRIEQ